jgi:hypothetical protein
MKVLELLVGETQAKVTEVVNVDLPYLQKVVEGCVDTSRARNLPKGCYLIVNEDGLTLQQEYNYLASVFSGCLLVGPAVIVGSNTEDGDFEGLTQEQIDEIVVSLELAIRVHEEELSKYTVGINSRKGLPTGNKPSPNGTNNDVWVATLIPVESAGYKILAKRYVRTYRMNVNETGDEYEYEIEVPTGEVHRWFHSMVYQDSAKALQVFIDYYKTHINPRTTEYREMVTKEITDALGEEYTEEAIQVMVNALIDWLRKEGTL